MPVKPSQAEDEYFARQEFERRAQAARLRQARVAGEERERVRTLHYMKCPKCGMDLAEIEYRGVKIDKCTGCGGIWLDPGEFEIVVEMERPALRRFFSAFRG